MTQVEIYTKRRCPYCAIAKADLVREGVVFTEIDVTTNVLREQEMVQRAKRITVPQVFVGDYHVGGSDDLHAAIESGGFKRIVADTAGMGLVT